MPQTARNLMLCAVALVVVVSIIRRSLDALALGALASGGLTIIFAAQSGFAASRYYIPLYALIAVAGCLSLARLPDAVQAAGVLVVFFAFIPVTETRDEVRRWSDEEQQHSEIVALVAGLERSGCTLAAAGLDAGDGSRSPSARRERELRRHARVHGRRCVFRPSASSCGRPPASPGVRGREARTDRGWIAAWGLRVRAAPRRRGADSPRVSSSSSHVGGRLRRVVALDDLLDEVQRTALDLVEDPSDVLADDSEAQELDASEEEHDDDD